MIVPMKKAAIILQQKDARGALDILRRLGVLHIEHQQPPAGKDISVILEDLALINNALGIILEAKSNSPVQKPVKGLSDWRAHARHIIDLHKRLEQLDEYSRGLLSTINQWISWGDFQPKEIEGLVKNNIYIRLCQIPVKKLEALPADVFVKIIHTSGGFANCAVVSQKKIGLPYKEVTLPKIGLKEMQARLNEDRQVIASIKAELESLSGYQQEFSAIKKRMENELEFYQALNGMAKTGALSYLTGYLPFDVVDTLAQTAKKEKWALVISEPSENDNVPTLIRNPRWISLISPVLKFLEIVPGYKELDISLPFLIFFSIFFGILIGDAGYGFVYCLITFLFQRNAKKRNLDTSKFFLFYILSFCAICWGVFTGTFFGHEWFIKAGFKPLIPALTNDKAVQRFCFLLGALHLSVAHSWRAVIKAPSLSALSDIGWMCVLWAAFFIAKMLILGDAFPFFGKWLIIAGVFLVVIFTNPQKNILKGIGEGLGTLALSLMNNFTDVVSYIRLFAVGLAGVAIADAFNAMAALVGRGNFFALLGSIFIVMVGHTLGIVLGPVSVLVHGVRLNVLEFSGHANVSWSGFVYKPLKEYHTD